ncbi:hypothetical protein RUMOBE_03111 [Blautia obeum ATCC 29174]|uniref:Uncharacterized protein n=1 Tax=Blautia obeum ATCC 29174 TaxID=411459 RepID=A5ZVR9_9FIRM|nr:hypothetical protein RUMOBE_03111 [Blautia obeum ATCC 29174]
MELYEGISDFQLLTPIEDGINAVSEAERLLSIYLKTLQDLFFVLADSKSADLASVVHNPRFSPCLISSLWSI